MLCGWYVRFMGWGVSGAKESIGWLPGQGLCRTGPVERQLAPSRDLRASSDV
jgi:hypothetical protein